MTYLSSLLPSEASFPRTAEFIREAQCGWQGFKIITVNLVAVSIFAANLARGGGRALFWPINFVAALVILPSIALFRPLNYFYYLPQPLLMGLTHAIVLATVDVDPETGIWTDKYPSMKFSSLAHFNDHRLAEALPGFLIDQKVNKVIDFGCGNNYYVEKFLKTGLKATGCDGNPATKEPCFVANLVADNFLEVARKATNEEQFDCVMSLEVAEHIPQKFEEKFLTNLTSLVNPKGLIILSWAQKGQGGLGHFNEQNADHVIEKMQEKGWLYQEKDSEVLRKQTSPHTPWFRNTIYVFKHKDAVTS